MYALVYEVVVLLEVFNQDLYLFSHDFCCLLESVALIIFLKRTNYEIGVTFSTSAVEWIVFIFNKKGCCQKSYYCMNLMM